MAEIRPIEKRRNFGLPPGTPVFIGEQMVEKVHLSYFQYNKEECTEGQITNIETDLPNFSDDKVTWINIIGIHDIKVLKKIGEILSIDALLLEDIANSSSRPKIEDLTDYYFFIIKDLEFETEKLELQQEHMAVIVSKNFVITFQEDAGDQFDKIRERLRENKGVIRKSGTDYLFNRLLDTIVDNYYVVVDKVDTQIENLESIVITDPTRETLQLIQDLKSELIYLRRLILPVRELVGIMTKLDKIVITDTTSVYVRSIYDHLNQIIDQIEIHREMLTGFLEIYLSSISNKTNDVMKVLTIITSIFIPLSFLAGVYGMNFEYMPELRVRYAYFILWGVFILLSAGMLYYFKKLGWLTME